MRLRSVVTVVLVSTLALAQQGTHQERTGSEPFPAYDKGRHTIAEILARTSGDVVVKGTKLLPLIGTPSGVAPYPPYLFIRETCGAPLAVVGKVDGIDSTLTEKGYFIYSRVSFLVQEVIRNRTSVQIEPERRIVVLQPGGVMQFGTRKVTAIDPHFALFQAGSRYALFLQSTDVPSTFRATPRGSFELKEDAVLPATGVTIQLPEMTDPSLFVQAARDAAVSCIDEK